jgi:hypothetical protein
MSDYLARLRALAPEKRLPHELPELPKDPSGSFGGSNNRHVPPAWPTSGGFGSSLSSHVSPATFVKRDLPTVAFSSERLQREADRRNLEALREGRTDRFCSCGRLARLAWPDGNRREVWRCDDCAQTAGRA